MHRHGRRGPLFTRRDFLKTTALGGAALALPWSVTSRLAFAKGSPSLTKFRDPLPIPGTIYPVNGQNIVMPMTQFSHEVHSEVGPVTTLWGYRGTSPGPTFDVKQGTRFTVQWENNLATDRNARHFLEIDPSVLAGIPDCTDNRKVVVHLHGGKITQDADGYPLDFLLPGESDIYDYNIVQDAAPLWYHDHAMGNTRLNVMMGLAGLFVVRSDYEENLISNQWLPSKLDEIPIVLQDRRVKENGQLAYDKMFDDSFFGDVMVVNGKAWPYMNVQARTYRLRLLNGSNTRSYTLQFGESAMEFHLIGTDLGFVDTPVPLHRITLTPGERADIIVNFASMPNSELVVINHDHSQSEHSDVPMIREVMQFRVGPAVTDPVRFHPDLQLRGTAMESLEQLLSQSVRERDFEFEDYYVAAVDDSEWLINDKKFRDIEEVIANGSVEVWNWVNKSEMMHPMHLHLAQSRIVGRYTIEEDEEGNLVPGQDLGVADYEKGWKDTVRVGPREFVKIVSRFDGQAGKAPGDFELFPYHCHILEHEDFEMMRQFKLVY